MSKRQPSAKQQLTQLEEGLKLKMLQRANRLMEMSVATDYWMQNYVDVLDRYRDGNQITYPISQPTDRRFGSNFPFWTSEAQLSLIRAQARVLVAMNPSAFGLVNGLTSYVIGPGFTYRTVAKDDRGASDEDAAEAQRVIDEFIEDNAWAEMEQELFFRSREDGESFLRMFPQPSGSLQVRTVEPEQVIQPPEATFQEWSYGIRTEPDDVFDIKAYHVHYLAPGGQKESNPSWGEIVSADEVVHIKCNVKRSIKRGLSDFSYDTHEILTQAGKLRRNMGEGASVQAAIAAIRQHDTATASQVESFVQQAIDYSTRIPYNGRQQDYQKLDAGSFLDIPKGMNYVPPPGAANATAHLSIFQALLRSAGVRHNAPEWLSSADASNNNFASSLTAESPFLRNCIRLQAFYKRHFLRVIKAALSNAAKVGRLPLDILDKLDITATPPSVETRNKGEEATANQTYITLGVKSRQTAAQELGLDWDTEVQNMQDYAEEMGPVGPPLPDEPDGGGNVPPEGGPEDAPPSPPQPESVTEADESKIKRDKDGKFSSKGGSGVSKAVSKAKNQVAKADKAKAKAKDAADRYEKAKAATAKAKADYKAKYGKDYEPGKKAKAKPAAKPAPKPKAKKEPAKAKAKPAKKDAPAPKPAPKQANKPAPKPAPSLAKLGKEPEKAGTKKTLAQRIGGALGRGARALGKAVAGSKLGREVKAAARDVKRDYRLAKMKAKKLFKREAVEGVAAKYDHIEFHPPAGARKAAKRALEVRAEKPESQRGMTPVGIARARDLSNGKELSPETVRRMKAYFDRHQKDKQGAGWDEQGAGWQAWMGWGGDAGYAWAKKVVRQMEAADKKGAE